MRTLKPRAIVAIYRLKFRMPTPQAKAKAADFVERVKRWRAEDYTWDEVIAQAEREGIDVAVRTLQRYLKPHKRAARRE